MGRPRKNPDEKIKKALIAAGVLAVVGVSAYFAWQKFGPKKAEAATRSGEGDESAPANVAPKKRKVADEKKPEAQALRPAAAKAKKGEK